MKRKIEKQSQKESGGTKGSLNRSTKAERDHKRTKREREPTFIRPPSRKKAGSTPPLSALGMGRRITKSVKAEEYNEGYDEDEDEDEDEGEGEDEGDEIKEQEGDSFSSQVDNLAEEAEKAAALTKGRKGSGQSKPRRRRICQSERMGEESPGVRYRSKRKRVAGKSPPGWRPNGVRLSNAEVEKLMRDSRCSGTPNKSSTPTQALDFAQFGGIGELDLTWGTAGLDSPGASWLNSPGKAGSAGFDGSSPGMRYALRSTPGRPACSPGMLGAVLGVAGSGQRRPARNTATPDPLRAVVPLSASMFPSPAFSDTSMTLEGVSPSTFFSPHATQANQPMQRRSADRGDGGNGIRFGLADRLGGGGAVPTITPCDITAVNHQAPAKQALQMTQQMSKQSLHSLQSQQVSKQNLQLQAQAQAQGLPLAGNCIQSCSVSQAQFNAQFPDLGASPKVNASRPAQLMRQIPTRRTPTRKPPPSRLPIKVQSIKEEQTLDTELRRTPSRQAKSVAGAKVRDAVPNKSVIMLKRPLSS
jgi:hypothetical protein